MVDKVISRCVWGQVLHTKWMQAKDADLYTLAQHAREAYERHTFGGVYENMVLGETPVPACRKCLEKEQAK